MPARISLSHLEEMKMALRDEGPDAMYAVIQSRGYNYAILARGVVSKSSLSGGAANTGSPEVKAIADGWISKVDTPSTMLAAAAGAAGTVKNRINSLFNDISTTVAGGQGTSQVTHNPAPTPAPVQPPPVIAKPPVRKRGRGVPPPTTGRGHPDSGFHGGRPSGGGRGGLKIDP